MEARWETWWDAHRLRYLERRHLAVDLARTTPTEGAGPIESPLTIARRKIVPHLLHVADTARAKELDDPLASSLIALAKVCDDEVTPRVLLDALSDTKLSPLVRSSAALAVGLLRRSDPALQRPPEAIARYRIALVETLDEPDTETSVRAFAALAIGLLADQGTKPDEPPMGRALLSRLTRKDLDQELASALLTAVGMLPPEAVSEENRDLLVAIADGRKAMRRVWSDVERSHALTAEVRLGGERGLRALLRSIGRRNQPRPVLRAAYLSVGEVARALTAPERLNLAKAVLLALERSHHHFERGLAYVALGHLLHADLRAGETGVLRSTHAGQTLLVEAERGNVQMRGYAILGLGIGARLEGAAARDEEPYETWLKRVRKLVADELSRAWETHPLAGAWAAAAGYARLEKALPDLASRVTSDKEHSWTRGVAAVALAQSGFECPEGRGALIRAVTTGGGGHVIHAAAGLWGQGVRLSDTKLLQELESAETEHRISELLVTLGRLGDLAAVDGLIRWMGDGSGRSDSSLALAAVALGLLGDPEPRPSLERIRAEGNYAGRTYALNEVWSIL
jgi:hypothetical protein